MTKEDCETMAKAYVDDIGQFLNIANKENVRILKGKTLIWNQNHIIPYYYQKITQ